MTEPTRSRTVVLYGGSFDPIHLGHLHVARACLDRHGVAEVRLLVSPQPPHKRDQALLPLADRVVMIEAAIAGEPRLVIDLTETQLPPPWYTYETLRAVRARLGPGHDVRFVIGADSLADLPKWHRARELVHETDFITVPRDAGDDLSALFARFEQTFPPEDVARLRAGVLAVAPLPISSTTVRARARDGLSLERFVPLAVERIIRERGFYRARAS